MRNMPPHEEYLRRRTNTGTLPLSHLHHRLMDQLFLQPWEEFDIEMVLEFSKREPAIFESQEIGQNHNRLRLLAIRTLDALEAVGMLRSIGKLYAFSWTP